MLLELRVENYAVIDNVAVEFASGLNLLTGETGAGKSILIDALALLLGDKASSDAVRHGTEKATVSAVFDVGLARDRRRFSKPTASTPKMARSFCAAKFRRAAKAASSLTISRQRWPF